uniref:Uncharacterized protein ycf2 n=1 Tax=Tanacetum cinerariifolium TaxID=118510 RepID=A0A6L2K2D8_TANCI|nr:uncharacterized protein ycf2 [Tanacetum cinerariifolium]
MQTQTSNALHDAIMEAGGKDRPPMLASGIDNDIYSTVDACPNACEIWKVIERLKQGESINAQDLETNLYLKFRTFTSRDGIRSTLYVQGTDNCNIFDDDQEYLEQPESVYEPYLDMCYDREHDDTDELAQERDLLASLIEKIKCEIDDIKNRNNFLETSNNALDDKLKGEIEDFKTINKSLVSSNNHFKEANNEVSKTNQLMFKELKKFHAELDRYHEVNYALKVTNDLKQRISDMKKELFSHQETISIMSQEKEAHIKFYKTRKYKEINKVIALENKVKVLDNIVYKTGQSVQTMNILNRNCKTSFAKPEFLKKDQRANPHLTGSEKKNNSSCKISNETVAGIEILFKEKDLKYLEFFFVYYRDDSTRSSFVQKTYNSDKNLSEIQLEHEKKDEFVTVVLKVEIVNRLLEEVERSWNGGLSKTLMMKERRMKKVKVVVKPITPPDDEVMAVLRTKVRTGPLSRKREMVVDLRYFNSLELKVDSLTSQLETQKTQFVNEIDRLFREYYYADHMNAILGMYTELDEVTNLQCDYLELLQKCEFLETEL